MVNKSPNWGLFPFQMAFSWLINGGDPNHLLTRMILQVNLSFFPEAELIGFGFLHGMAAHQVRFPAT